jgi:hypothetical protein
MMDSGSSTGEITGHAKASSRVAPGLSLDLTVFLHGKAINAVSIRHQRPFRAVSAADDATIVFHQGMILPSISLGEIH